MSKESAFHRHLFLVALGVGLAACSLDSGLPNRNGNAAPLGSAVTLSGVGAQDDDAGVGSRDTTRISDITGSSAGSAGNRASADGMTGGTDSGGGFGEGAEQIGGAASIRGGAAGAGGDAGSGESGASVSSSAKEPPVLWLSEYVEGSSSNKALEITSSKRATLDGCKVGTHFNGKLEATVVATLSGVLEAGQVLTLCTSTLKEKLGAACNQIGNLTFNGDDVVTLSCDGIILDVIGQIGVDPGAAWGSDGSATAEHTLRRLCSVSSGDPLGSDPFDPSLQWQAFPVDTFDGLGALGCQ
ncbi:MAG TPA: hypothetical protein VJV79_25630 [Polyangiaceae bacterium]|nr:hypothetical protein [Polyangiaceae bacterium]